MNDFSLAPFLNSLSAQGLRVTLSDYQRIALVLRANQDNWTLTRLRNMLVALLASDEEQERLIVRQFNGFFDLNLDAASRFANIDVGRALADLATLAQASKKPGRQLHQLYTKSYDGLKEAQVFNHVSRLWTVPWFPALATFLFVITVGLLGLIIWRRGQLQTPVNPDANQPVVITSPLDGAAVIIGFFITIMALTGIGLLIGKLLRARAPKWNLDGPHHFPFGLIGGPPVPRLDQSSVERLADSLGYFRSQEDSKAVDLPASVEATIKQGGAPSLIYQRQKRPRAVIILEDVSSEPLLWNNASRELEQGLRSSGTPVVVGTFVGSPMDFQTDETNYHLEDLEGDRNNYLLLIFSDSKGLKREDNFALEFLARWPMIAWMELREPKFWDDSTAKLAHYKIPIHPATSEGLENLSKTLQEEGISRHRFYDEPQYWRGVPSQIGTDPSSDLEYLLGDSLLWAQACAILQPVSLGLADSLRREFYSHLPPQRIDRLFMIPGTNYGAGGLRFSRQVLKALRMGFRSRHSGFDQQQIQTFIMGKVAERKPDQRDSLAYLIWESTIQRIRMGLEPEKAVKRLKALSRSPLGAFIDEELEMLRSTSAYPSVNTELLGAWGFITGVDFWESKPNIPDVIPARAWSKVGAEYPRGALARKISGQVYVTVRIDRSGNVRTAHGFSGPEILRLAAAQAASQWKFHPATSLGRNVEYSETIIFRFQRPLFFN